MGIPAPQVSASEALRAAGIEPLRLGRGARSHGYKLEFHRNLTAEDLLKAATEPTPQDAASPIVQLRQSHHMVARLLARNIKHVEIAAISGYTPARISTLLGSPAFANLVQFYRDMEAEGYKSSRADMHERLASLGFDAIETLHEKLIDAPEGFDNKTLLAIIEATSDRTGYGKTSTVNNNVTVGVSDEAIAKIKAATSSGREIAPADRGALLRIAAGRTSELHSDAIEGEWVEVEGPRVREEAGEGAGGESEAPSADLPSVD